MQEISAFLDHMDWAGLLDLIILIAAVLVCLMVHEVSHGLAAYFLGDPTAKAQHRLSLNPLRHIDPFGALMMLLVGFGWAKPVPVDTRYFKKPKLGMALTALAGPFSNFILAYVVLVIGYFLIGMTGGYASTVLTYVIVFLLKVVNLSIGLGVFNLIPFPPLDGSKILGLLVPDRIYYKILRYEFAGTFILMALLWSGVLDLPLYAVQRWIYNALNYLAHWPLLLL